MQSRETRFVLRIESGERQGEEVPLPVGTLQVGRKPECGLVLKDGSVSGKHAEFRVSEAGVELVDLGSTNGTRVGGEKIEQKNLGHGDALVLGSVRMTLHDGRFAAASAQPSIEAPLTAAPARAAVPPESGALGKVSADKLERSGSGSRLPQILMALLVVAGGGAYAALRFLGPRSEGGTKAVLPDVPGNLLADGSFEQGTGEWTAAEAVQHAFLRDRGFAHTGDVGLGVNLEENGWSLARSAEFSLHARRSLSCAASLRVDQEALGRFGVELSSAGNQVPAVIAWAPARRATNGFEAFELALDVPGGYDRARVLIAGSGHGSVALDDVSALEKEPLGGGAKRNEYELVVLGNEGSTAALVRSGRVLLAGLDLSAWNRTGLSGWPEAKLAAHAGESGFRLVFPGAPKDAVLRFYALRPDAQGSGAGSASDAWVATTGSEGYAAHGGDFTRAGVTSLLLGSGLELLRVGFAHPVDVSATGAEGALLLSIQLGGLEECEFQLTFQKERAEASGLAAQAEQKESAKDLGGALAAWTELLDRFPFERALVTKAEGSRARLVQTGLAEVDRVRRELVRARFFLLPELFRQGRDRAQELAAQYKGSEVEVEALKTAQECQTALDELSIGSGSGAAALLKGVLETLDPSRAPKLVEHVRNALQAVDHGGKGN